MLLPEFTVTGNVIPLTEYPCPFQAAEDTATSALLAVRVPVKVELLPTATLPKASVEGVTASCPEDGLFPEGGFWFCEPDETPAQPVSTTRLAAIRSTPKHVSRNRITPSTE